MGQGNNLSKYEAVKDEMKSGDLIQWGAHNLLGTVIQGFTHSNVSHSSLVIRLAEYEGTERRRFTTEALGRGVMLNLLSKRLENHNGRAWWYPLQDEWNDKRQGIGEKALSFIGVPYDFGSVVKFLFAAVSANALRLFCSELCFVAWGFTGPAPVPGDLTNLDMFKDRVQLL